jgi:ribonuclease HI
MSQNDNSPEATAGHLRSLEASLLDPPVRRDRQRVSALLADDFTEIGASGRLWTREAILALLATEDFVPPTIEDFSCRQLAEGVVLATYRAVRTGPVTQECSTALRNSIWTKEDGGWKLRFHQGTQAGEPGGLRIGARKL